MYVPVLFKHFGHNPKNTMIMILLIIPKSYKRHKNTHKYQNCKSIIH